MEICVDSCNQEMDTWIDCTKSKSIKIAKYLTGWLSFRASLWPAVGTITEGSKFFK